MRNWLLVVAFVLVTSVSNAKEFEGVELPDQIQVRDDLTLTLNGGGVRTKFFFSIYAGGLYLQQPSQDSGKIITADSPALIRMHFIYDGVSADKMQETWQEGFAQAGNVPDDAAASFIALFDREVKENDVYDLTYLPDSGMHVKLNDKELAVVPGLDLKKALFAIWVGDKPVDSDLKEGMLGKE